jgi:hypothetical protein
MGFSRGPKIVTDGLILAVDAGNPKCLTPGNTFGKNLITGGDLTGASGTPSSGTHTPNSANFPAYNSTNGGVFDFAGGRGINCDEDLGSHSVVTLIMWFYKNSSGTHYFTDARNDGGQWFLSNYSGENINYTDAMRYNFDATYNASNSDFLNNWIHMAVVSDGGGSLLYLNGYEISSHPTFRTSYVSNGSIDEDLGKNFRIGTRYTTSAEWTGLFGPIYIYERALSAEEVYQSFNAQRERFGL